MVSKVWENFSFLSVSLTYDEIWGIILLRCSFTKAATFFCRLLGCHCRLLWCSFTKAATFFCRLLGCHCRLLCPRPPPCDFFVMGFWYQIYCMWRFRTSVFWIQDCSARLRDSVRLMYNRRTLGPDISYRSLNGFRTVRDALPCCSYSCRPWRKL